MMKYLQILLFYFLFDNGVYGILPDDFDALMEKFFETPECESFVSDGTYLSVATSACSPYTCDAPRQLCMREANRFQDETANQCRPIPEVCLTAANGGIPVGSSRTIHTTPSPSIFGGMRGNPSATINGNRPPPQIVTAPPDFRGTPPPPPRPFTSGAFGDICQQTVPDGRFCGFQLKFTYNRETGNCEQFWFPGCATDKTNDNLFGDLQSCQIATKHCRG
uniref:BPTI/Kunitz inhibitor domain-containing protein n=1 Tax=Panagrolaimus sp. PS1159 TaxID=55785 RepID=A0AC35EWF8_9BILA